MVCTSAWALGSLWGKTAFRARTRRSLFLVCTISAPKGTGFGVLIVNAVQAARSRICLESIAESAGTAGRGAPWRGSHPSANTTVVAAIGAALRKVRLDSLYETDALEDDMQSS